MAKVLDDLEGYGRPLTQTWRRGRIIRDVLKILHRHYEEDAEDHAAAQDMTWEGGPA